VTTALTPTAVTTCEACWNAPVESVRVTAAGTDLLCQDCALGHFPRRVDTITVRPPELQTPSPDKPIRAEPSQPVRLLVLDIRAAQETPGNRYPGPCVTDYSHLPLTSTDMGSA